MTNFLALVRICAPASGPSTPIENDQESKVDIKAGEVIVCNVVRSLVAILLSVYRANTRFQ